MKQLSVPLVGGLEEIPKNGGELFSLLPSIDWRVLDSDRPADFLFTREEFRTCKTREAAYSLLFAAHLKLMNLARNAGLFVEDREQWETFFRDFHRLNCEPIKAEPAAGTPPFQFKADLRRGLSTLTAILTQNVLPALRTRPMPAVRKADIVDVNAGTKTLIEETYALEIVDDEEDDVSDAATDITPRPVFTPSVISVGGSFAVPRVRTPDHLKLFGTAGLTPAPDKGPALLSDEDMNGALVPAEGPAAISLFEQRVASMPKVGHNKAPLTLNMPPEMPSARANPPINLANPFDEDPVTDVSGVRPSVRTHEEPTELPATVGVVEGTLVSPGPLPSSVEPTRPFDTRGMESAMDDTLARQIELRPSFLDRLGAAAGSTLGTVSIIVATMASAVLLARTKPSEAPVVQPVVVAATATPKTTPTPPAAAAAAKASVFTPLWTQVRQTMRDDKTAAEVTNALVNGQYSTHSWQTVQQAHPWKTDGRALKAAVGHLESWGGYQAPLDSWKLCVSKGMTPTIDHLMTCLEDDHARYGKDSDEVAYRVAAQVSMMHDGAIYGDLKEVEGRHTTLANHAASAFESGTVTGQIEAPQGGERLGQLDSVSHPDALAQVQWKDTLNKLADEMEGDISELHRWARGKNRAAIVPFMEDFVAGVRKTAALGNGSPEELRSRTLALKDKFFKELKGFERRGTLAAYLQRASAKIMKGLDASIAPLYAETVDSQQERAQDAVRATLPEEPGFTAEEAAWFA